MRGNSSSNNAPIERSLAGSKPALCVGGPSRALTLLKVRSRHVRRKSRLNNASPARRQHYPTNPSQYHVKSTMPTTHLPSTLKSHSLLSHLYPHHAHPNYPLEASHTCPLPTPSPFYPSPSLSTLYPITRLYPLLSITISYSLYPITTSLSLPYTLSLYLIPYTLVLPTPPPLYTISIPLYPTSPLYYLYLSLSNTIYTL